MKKYELTVLETHPVQYRVPIYKKLAKNPKINLNVYFCSDVSIKLNEVNEFGGVKTKWISSLDGFKFKFLKNYYPFNKNKLPKGLWNFGILKELIKDRPDAILIYGYQSFSSKIAIFLSTILKIPIIFREEIDFINESTPIKNKIKKIIFPFLFKLPSVFLYSYTKSMEFYKFQGVGKEKLFFHPCAVDNDFFQKESKRLRGQKNVIRKKFNISIGTKVITYVGRFTRRKRLLDILYAYNKLNNKNKYSLIFIGGGELREKIKEYSIKHNLKNVHIIDFINYKDISRIYTITDLYIIPSSYDPSPKTMSEAMNFSVPIISSENVGTSSDLIKNGKNGYIIKVGDINNLANKMGEILSNNKLQKNMGKKSLEIVSKWNFDRDVEATLKALNHIYRNGKN